MTNPLTGFEDEEVEGFEIYDKERKILVCWISATLPSAITASKSMFNLFKKRYPEAHFILGYSDPEGHYEKIAE